MNEPQELHDNRYSRLAVWALRAGYVALAITGVGVIVLATASTPWVLAVGVIGWLGAAAVTLIGVLRALHELSNPRPGLLAHADSCSSATPSTPSRPLEPS